VPIFDKNRRPVGVLDVDSDKLNDFDDRDAKGLESITSLLTEFFE